MNLRLALSVTRPKSPASLLLIDRSRLIRRDFGPRPINKSITRERSLLKNRGTDTKPNRALIPIPSRRIRSRLRLQGTGGRAGGVPEGESVDHGHSSFSSVASLATFTNEIRVRVIIARGVPFILVVLKKRAALPTRKDLAFLLFSSFSPSAVDEKRPKIVHLTGPSDGTRRGQGGGENARCLTDGKMHGTNGARQPERTESRER